MSQSQSLVVQNIATSHFRTEPTRTVGDRRNVPKQFSLHQSQETHVKLSTDFCSLPLLYIHQIPRASGFSITEWIQGEDGEQSNTYTPKEILSMLDISEMLVRDIKRRLA